MTPNTTEAKPARDYPKARPKVPPFARFEGTSAFKKDLRRAREYARYRQALKAAKAPE